MPSAAAMAPRPEPTFSWFLPIDGDGDRIGTERAQRPPTLAILGEVAQAAERHGFSSVLVPTRFANGLFESSAPLAETWTVAAMLAARTSRLRFLVAVRPGFVSAGLFAQMAAGFANLSGGRLDLNIVPGGIAGEFERFGVTAGHDDRYAQGRELIDALRTLWDAGGPADFHGTTVHLEGAQAPVWPGITAPRFYLGGASEAALALAGTHADVLLAWIQPQPAMAELVARAHRHAMKPNRQRPLTLGLRTHIVAAPSESAAWDGARDLLSEAATTVKAQRQSVFTGTAMVGQRAQLATGDDPVDAHRIGAHLWNGISTVRVNCGTAIVGDYAQVAAELADYWRLGFYEFILSVWPHAEGAETVATEVIPRLREMLRR